MNWRDTIMTHTEMRDRIDELTAERDALALRLDSAVADKDEAIARMLRTERRLEACENERLDLLARVGYAEGAGAEGLRRWELAEERAKAAERRLEALLETRSSLLELVCLKRHKEAVGKDDYYIEAQPKAWARAHAALNAVAIQERGVERRVRICGAPLSSSRSKNCLLPEGHSGSHQFSTSPE